MNTFRSFAFFVVVANVSLARDAAANKQVIPIYQPCNHRGDYVQRGQLVARAEIAKGKLHRFVYFGNGIEPPTEKDRKAALIERDVLVGMGVKVTLEQATDIVDCTVHPYRVGYEGEMEAAMESKFGKSYRSGVERAVAGRMPEIRR